ncbi:hypothetical protein [Herbiconiux sp. YIM B11900]|uniref:hypothetical protein n=1 Tax=Herbiconiux sp. YIM B11900 TaxID=3404131 RepID=UPI003F8640FE
MTAYVVQVVVGAVLVGGGLFIVCFRRLVARLQARWYRNMEGAIGERLRGTTPRTMGLIGGAWIVGGGALLYVGIEHIVRT